MRHSRVLCLGLAVAAVSATVPATATAQATHATPRSPAAVGMPRGWSAGPVHRWTGYTRPNVGSRRVREVQRRLNRLGYESGPVDGLFGPLTERATRRFQTRHDLRVDGVVGPKTLRVLRKRDPGPRSHAGRPAKRRAQRPQGTRPQQPSISLTQPSPDATPARARQPGPNLAVPALVGAMILLGFAIFFGSYVWTRTRVAGHADPTAAPIARGPRRDDRGPRIGGDVPRRPRFERSPERRPSPAQVQRSRAPLATAEAASEPHATEPAFDVDAIGRASPGDTPTAIRNRALLAMMRNGGVTLADVLELRGRDVDRRARVVRFLGRGDLRLGPLAFALLSRWLDARDALGVSPDAPLFCGRGGRPLNRAYARRLVTRLAEEAAASSTTRPGRTT
jgi:peptidoglycan hydrolase-like protein with peptidoglycan-binding domain